MSAVSDEPEMEYLSSAWITAADRLLRSGGPCPDAPDPELVIGTAVKGCSDGTRRYAVRFAPGGLSIAPAEDAHVTLHLSWPTAVSVATGSQSAQAAFLAGDIQLGGDINRLIRHAGLVALVGDVLSGLRGRTSFGALPTREDPAGGR